jgi:ribosomal protein L16/L10AE
MRAFFVVHVHSWSGVSAERLHKPAKMLGSLQPPSWRTPSQLLSLGPRIFARGRAQLAPRKVEHIKRHKGRIPIPIGGSIKGTTLAFGTWGIRIKGNGVRLSAKQLTTAEEAIKRKIKVIKDSKVYLRVFPHIPVCVKVRFRRNIYSAVALMSGQGNETRMGKGKGTFEFWAAR